MAQSVVREGRGIVLILNDCSTDDWAYRIADWLIHPRLVVVNATCGSAARARNALLDFVDTELPSVHWVARLDADDRLVDETVVAALAAVGSQDRSLYVLGSNHLEQAGKHLPVSNIAREEVLKDRKKLRSFIEGFCLLGQSQELPSCNLLLKRKSGIRYPDVKSAEDHWLVSELLFLHPEQGSIVPEPVYAIYSLGGSATQQNRRSEQWVVQRTRLAAAIKCWEKCLITGKDILGVGQEGIVWRDEQFVIKDFYDWPLTHDQADQIDNLLANQNGPVPSVQWLRHEDGSISCRFPYFDSLSLPDVLPVEQVFSYMKRLHQCGYITSNIKRSNMRLTPQGELVYIDIGKDIVPFSPSRFLDAAARLYSIGVLGNSDHELARRQSLKRQHEALADDLPGFSRFYRQLVENLYPHCCLENHKPTLYPQRCAEEVSLLIKACPQDKDLLEQQVYHLSTQLSYPARFHRIILLIDTFSGPFLRQYAPGDLPRARQVAATLRKQRIVDEVWETPDNPCIISATYQQWFGRTDITESHTTIGAPVFAQLWAFDRIETPYVLQCDVDVLVGRRDANHDFLADMLKAIDEPNTICVGFNIAQIEDGFIPYFGDPGQYAPEVRFGLLHLPRMKALAPLPNTISQGKLELMWHRSMQQKLAETSGRVVRGGDCRSFYVHPQNSDKQSPAFSQWRDLIAQGRVSLDQKGQWNLDPQANWSYPRRSETLVFLLKGRKTSYPQLQRCIGSLARQSDQRFGIIIIDDGSALTDTWFIPMLMGDMWPRTTLIRHENRQGYIPNFILAVEEICIRPDTFVVTLDIDDALMSSRVASRLLRLINAGADVVHGAMFRPEKPLQLYEPDYVLPRQKGGGGVWMHLRGFRKSLFEALPKSYLKTKSGWTDEVTDYALMLPLCEMARKPVFIDDLFCYYHQRPAYSAERQQRQQSLLQMVINRAPAVLPDTAAPASGAA